MTTPPLAALRLPVRAGRPEGDGWVAADRLLGPGSPALEERVRAFGRQIGAERPAVAASLLLEAYAGLVAGVAFGYLVGAGHAPELAAANVSLRFQPGQVPDALALHDPLAVAVHDLLPGGRGRPGRAGQPAQLGRLASSLLDGHLGVLVARLEELRVGRGPRALWGLVANGCGAAIAQTAERTGRSPQQARELAEAFFGLPGSPLPGPPRLLEVPLARGTRLVRKRLSCCLSYALAGCDYCVTCPVFSDGRATELAAARLTALAGDG